MGMINGHNAGDRTSAHLIARAALVLAERAYADGNSEDAAHLVDVAHRLFGAALEAQSLMGAVSH